MALRREAQRGRRYCAARRVLSRLRGGRGTAARSGAHPFLGSAGGVALARDRPETARPLLEAGRALARSCAYRAARRRMRARDPRADGAWLVRDRPSGAELAMLAEALGGEDALAARCNAIFARERDAGDEAFAACRAALAARYGAGADEALLARLAAEIRAGALDEGSAERAPLAALLRAITAQKLRESSPSYDGT